MKSDVIAIAGAGSKVARAIIPMLLQETDSQLVLLSSGRENPYKTNRVTWNTIDYADKQGIRAFFLKELPSVIINTAAMTNVDACETERGQAWFSNVSWVENLVRVAKVIDAHFVHFSTDYVFDGTKGPYAETDRPKPLNYYGKSKLASENVCLSSQVRHTIVRTNVVYGSISTHDFVRWTLKQLHAGKECPIVADQYSNPTFTDDIAVGVLRLVESRREGIYHFGGQDYVSRYEFAKRIAAFFHMDPALVKPISTSELKQKARRPLKGGLVSLKAQADLEMSFCNLESGLTTLRYHMHNEQAEEIR